MILTEILLNAALKKKNYKGPLSNARNIKVISADKKLQFYFELSTTTNFQSLR